MRTEGGLLPQEFLSRIQAGDPELPGVKAQDYHLGQNERIGEAVNRAWSRLQAAWSLFKDGLAQEAEGSLATSVTRDAWLLPFFQELGYGRLPKGGAIEVDGKSYAISHTWHRSPIHLLGCGVDLDTRQKGVAGAAMSSPHGLVQDFLNRSEDHLWGFLGNGYQLRVLRDHHSLTRQAYVEFDLQAIMDGEQYSEFLLLWLVCHQSRVEADVPEECWLETWVNTSRDEGVRALDKLRDGVEKAIESFGTGFLAHRANTRLKDALETGELDTQDYYRQILRLVYRLLFLFVAEERDALLDPNATEEARERYRRYYATRRLRDLADKRRSGPHGDFWRGLALVMERLDNGCPELGLPALGSRLWGPSACPRLMEAECANEHVLTAIRHLSHIQEGKTRYAVNWRNVGADELGSIYESLLERHPRIHKEAATFNLETAAGHERKTTGSYYTPTSLVDCLLDSALDPVLDEVRTKPDPEQAILDLKVCDPACGSGHFLVAAARRIARRLASVRSGDDEPSPRDVQKALRDVVGRCIYGVDLNPMAVELCKVSLWMEAIEPGLPLSFLDSHIHCGNAVLGATRSLMSQGIPDDAFKPIEGDDKGVAKRLKKRNRDERKGQTTLFRLFVAESGVDISDLADQAGGVEAVLDDNIDAVREKEKLWNRLSHSPEFKDAWFRADAWCTAFVWPKQPGDLENAAVTHGTWRRIQRDSSQAPPVTRKTVRELAKQYGFFHWHLAFPMVFPTVEEEFSDTDTTGCTGGFDAVIGNPPWDKLTPDATEFFSEYDDAIRTQTRAEKRATTAELLKDESIDTHWRVHCRERYGQIQFVKISGRYRLFAPGNLGKGDLNVFRMFVEHALDAVREGGFVCQLVPDSLYNGANCMAIRKALLQDHELSRLLGFANRRRVWFPGIHGSAKFALYAAQKVPGGGSFEAAFNISKKSELSSLCLLTIPTSLVRRFSPEALAVMEFDSQDEIDIAAQMYSRWPLFAQWADGQLKPRLMKEVDMTVDSGLFVKEPPGLPVYEGYMVGQYDHAAKAYRSGRGRSAVWEALSFTGEKTIRPQWWIRRAQVPEKLRGRAESYRIGFCDVASPTNERSLMATLLPKGVVAGNTVPTITFEPDECWVYLTWLAIANSMAMDFLVRKKVSLHLSWTVLNGLPFPMLQSTDAAVRFLSARVLALVCTTEEMLDLWTSAAERSNLVASAKFVPGVLDEEPRRTLRCEIDAYVAGTLFGLDRKQLGYILDTFPIVKKRDTKRYGDYRTKHQILEIYDAMQRAIDTGEPYRTLPDPPPADSRGPPGEHASRVPKQTT